MTAAELCGETKSGDREAPLFRLEHVDFAIAVRTVLSGLDLTLAPRRVVGLIGPNGSGKSTLVKLLARQSLPAAGSVEFQGQPLGAYRGRELARRLAYLPQTPPVADGMTAYELVALGRYPHHGAFGRLGAHDRTAIEDAMERTGTVMFRERPVDALSGGERQRVWLAMLIAQGAACLILDEPTSALDVAHQAEMLALVRRLCDAHSLSVIIVLHDINMAARTCDRLVALKSGRIVADGAPPQIMRPDILAAIYDVPMGIVSQPDSGAPIAYVA